jgi:transposase
MPFNPSSEPWLLDGDGRPVCTEMWPGNAADVTSLIPAIDRLPRRFRINRVCVVADRGMISAETIAELEARGLLYVLGVRELLRNGIAPADIAEWPGAGPDGVQTFPPADLQTSMVLIAHY